VEVEMDEETAKKSLPNFETWLKGVAGREIVSLRKEIAGRESLAAEQKKLSKNAALYADKGWGDW
jgi:hypothetical protein